MAFHLGSRARAAVRYVGIAIATLLTFLIGLQLTFPYERIKARAVEALADKYDLTIGDIERSWVPGRFALKAVTLRTRPAKSDDPVTTFYVERLEIDVKFLPLLHGGKSADIDAKIGAGHITGNIAYSNAGSSVHLDGSDLPSVSLPMRELLGLPMSGKVQFSVALDLPNEVNKLTGRMRPDWSQADGEIDFSCPTGCSIGDGKTKLKPKLKNARSQAFAADGIEFGPVDIQSLFAEVSITSGGGDGKPGKILLKRFDTKSLDGELKVDFMMTTTPDINESPVSGCLRFKGSEVLNKRVPKTFAELQTTGALIGPDGLFHIKLTDKFREIRRLPQTCGPDTNTPIDTPAAGGPTPTVTRRPNLVVTPPDAGVTGPPPTVQPLPATPPPPPPTGPSVTVTPTVTPTPAPGTGPANGAPNGAPNGSGNPTVRAEGEAAPAAPGSDTPAPPPQP